MLFVLIIFIVGIIFVVTNLIHGNKADAKGCALGFLGLIVVAAINLSVFGLASDEYTELKSSDNPVETQTIEAMPYNKNLSEDIYVVRNHNTQGNSSYEYCVETEDGLNTNSFSHPIIGDVYINYIDNDEDARLEHQSTSQQRVLTKKPSFWFNFFAWCRYHDYSIGDVVEVTDSSFYETYVFYVPEGSLHELWETTATQ